MVERKMAFYELGDGRLGMEFQKKFEHAQELAFERGQPVSVSLKVSVFPPERGNEGYGKVKYAISLAEPAVASAELFTKLNGCYIGSDNRDPAMLDQLQLEFKDTAKAGVTRGK